MDLKQVSNFFVTKKGQPMGQKRQFLFLILMILVITIGISSIETNSNSAKAETELEGIETKIPEGFVLVPIELINKSAFSSLIGGFTLVDLYSLKEDGSKNKKIASFVRLLRAPLNPDEFAALIEEERAGDVISNINPLYATIRNPNQKLKQSKNQSFADSKLTVEYEK